VTDIERLAEFSGPSHLKGVQILSGYLNGHYAVTRPLSLSASLAFEQSYGPIDGDSASTAELIAILSAIADVPLKQGIGITGSINQHGIIQPLTNSATGTTFPSERPNAYRRLGYAFRP
jgi:predicted ATP-dependent protease